MINLSYKISIERERRRARYRNPPIFAAISYTVSKESLDSLYHQRALTRLSILNIDTTETLNLSFEEGKLSLLLWFPRATIYFSIRKNRKFPNLSPLLFLLYLNSRMKVFWTRSNSKADRKHAEKCINFHTGIRLAVAVGPGGRCAVPGLHFQRVRSLLLSIEHHLREDLPGLPIDLEVILPLVSVAVHHVISDLKRKPDFPLL